MILEHYYSDFECDQGVGSGGEETDSEVWDFIDETMVGSQGTSDTDSEEECSSCEVQSTLHPDVRSGDLNRVLKQQRHLNDQEKLYFLLEHSFVPPPEYEFPVRLVELHAVFSMDLFIQNQQMVVFVNIVLYLEGVVQLQVSLEPL